MADVPPGRADLVVAFSGRCEGNKAGWTCAVRPIRRRHLGMRDTHCEPGHGAGDSVARAGASLRRFPSRQQRGVGDAKGGPADRFDDQTTRILRLTRDFDFSQGVTSLTPETRRAWSAIYAEGHAKRRAQPARGGLRACRVDAAAPGEAAGSRGGSARGHQARRDRGAAARDAGPCLRQHRSPRGCGARAPDRQGARLSTHGGADSPWVRPPAAQEGRGRALRVSGRAADGPASGTSVCGSGRDAGASRQAG